MCVVLQHTSWQGDPLAASPLHPLGLLVLQGAFGPPSHQQNVSPFYHSQEETSLSSCTSIDQGDVAPLWNPRSKGRRWLSPLSTPSTKTWRRASPPGPTMHKHLAV